jgi:hypothetical protein
MMFSLLVAAASMRLTVVEETQGASGDVTNREFSPFRPAVGDRAGGQGYCRRMAVEPRGDERVRTAELIAALCLATDLGMGFPFEHGLHTTVIAMRVADRLGVDRRTASETYYACLLSHAGCTTDAHVAAEVFGGSLTASFNPLMYGSGRDVLTGLLRALPDPGSPALVRAAQTARRLPRMARESNIHISAACEVAGMLADRMGAPPSVPGLLAHLTERWDGKGPLRRAKGDEIPCRCGSSMLRRTLLCNACLAARSTPRKSYGNAPATPSTRRSRLASSTRVRGFLRSTRAPRRGRRFSRPSRTHC